MVCSWVTQVAQVAFQVDPAVWVLEVGGSPFLRNSKTESTIYVKRATYPKKTAAPMVVNMSSVSVSVA